MSQFHFLENSWQFFFWGDFFVFFFNLKNMILTHTKDFCEKLALIVQTLRFFLGPDFYNMFQQVVKIEFFSSRIHKVVTFSKVVGLVHA
jgi:hypothetical protein